MKTFTHALLMLAIVASFSIPELHADTLSDGYISGQVTATTGEALANTVVIARDDASGFEASAKADKRGLFRFPLLRPGVYSLQATASGFEDTPLGNVTVKAGSGTHVLIAMQSVDADEMFEEIEVVASSISLIDLHSSETVITLTEAQVDTLPLARDATGVALLAPGAIRGDSFFSNNGPSDSLASFGGSSVAENAYYINGMNITDFRNGQGGSEIPFEFLSEVQVKSSGISAEYGRATGGFINAVSKRGTNDFEYGVGIYYEPRDLRASVPTVIAEDGTPAELGGLKYQTLSEAYIYASGPIIEDKLFFYGLYNPREFEGAFAGNVYIEGGADEAFWGFKLDYEVAENHSLELTAFSDEQDFVDTTYNLDIPTQTIQESRGDVIFGRGGEHWILKYSGNLSDAFTLSALVGQSEANLNQTSEGDECPVIFDNRAPEFFTNLGCWISVLQSADFDERDIARLDIEWRLGRHLLRAGLDRESNTSFSEARYSGDDGWIYFDAVPGEMVPTGTVPAGVDQVANHLVFSIGGSFDIKTQSWYIEDSWQVSDELTLNIGLRNESFDNRNAAGETFVKITDQWAPRLGAAWDVLGDGTSKLYASFGRYYLPIASNTNIRLSGREFFIEEWFVLDGLNADDTPILGPQIGETIVFVDGEIKDPETLVDKTIDPMYQDEYTLGFEKALWEKYVVGISAVRRTLESTIEDVTIDAALNDYAQANGFDMFMASGFDHYILTNPGTDMRVRIDLDFDGTPETI